MLCVCNVQVGARARDGVGTVRVPAACPLHAHHRDSHQEAHQLRVGQGGGEDGGERGVRGAMRAPRFVRAVPARRSTAFNTTAKEKMPRQACERRCAPSSACAARICWRSGLKRSLRWAR